MNTEELGGRYTEERPAQENPGQGFRDEDEQKTFFNRNCNLCLAPSCETQYSLRAAIATQQLSWDGGRLTRGIRE